MTAPVSALPEPKRYRSSTLLSVPTPETLPAGVIGQVEGIALVYGVIDTYGTTFSKGCLDRTVRERVAAGKVKLFWDHGDAPISGGMYDTDLHIGVVRAVWDDVTPDGHPCARFRADIFDTEAGRKAHEYLRVIAATGSETGVSIGMLREPAYTATTVGGASAFRIDEVALGEISVTSMSSVPGTMVTTVRADINYLALLDGIVAHLGHAAVRAHLSPILSDASNPDSNAASGSPAPADSNAVADDRQDASSRNGSEPSAPDLAAQRLAWARENFLRLYQ